MVQFTVMESIKSALFENPTYIYVALGVAAVAAGALWYERRRPKFASALAAVVVVAAAVFVTEMLVVTARERISAALYEMADQVQSDATPAQRTEAIEAALDDAVIVDLPDRFGEMDMDKQRALAAGRLVLAGGTIKSVRVVKLEVTVDRRHARSDFTTVIRYDTRDLGVRPGAVIWCVHWIKRDAGWRIIRVEQPRQGIEP